MANDFLTIKGLDQLMVKLKNLPDELTLQIGHEIQNSADNIVRAAKRDAPTDIGGLHGHISKVIIDPLNVEVVSSAWYSPFVEFGTRTKVNIPAGYEEYAAQFKGQKGSGGMEDFFQNILDWVKRTGISGTYSVKSRKRVLSTKPGKYQRKSYVLDQEDKKAAYAIMHSLLTKGMEPHPFFFHNFFAEEPKLIERINNIIKDL